MHKILLWLGYPMVKNFEDIFIRLTQLTNVTDTQTDRRTDTARQHPAYASHRAAKTMNQYCTQKIDQSRLQ